MRSCGSAIMQSVLRQGASAIVRKSEEVLDEAVVILGYFQGEVDLLSSLFLKKSWT